MHFVKDRACFSTSGGVDKYVKNIYIFRRGPPHVLASSDLAQHYVINASSDYRLISATISAISGVISAMIFREFPR